MAARDQAPRLPQTSLRDLEERMRYSCITSKDTALLAGLKEPFEHNADQIMEAFYGHLQSFEPLNQVLSVPGTLDRLIVVQKKYLRSLTRLDKEKSYLEDRLRIGRVHEQIGLAPQWYLGAYCKFSDLLIPIVREHYAADPAKCRRAVQALIKVMNLDSQIVLDAYFEVRQQKAVERSERLAAVGELAASIAHEVRNPLAGMKGALQVLRKDLVLDDSKAEIMDEVLAQIVRLENLVRDLLTFGRPNPLNLNQVDLHGVLDRSLRVLQEGIDASGITIRRTYGPCSDPIVADALQLEQVFLNLIGNAVQAMSGGGTLGIRTKFSRHDVEMRFRDTGAGIAPADLPLIFQPFHTTKHRGSGLGLSIVKKILDAHGGTIDVESTVGEGTTMILTLPRSEAE